LIFAIIFRYFHFAIADASFRRLSCRDFAIVSLFRRLFSPAAFAA